MRRPANLLLALVSVLSLVAAACGDDDGEVTAGDGEPTSTTSEADSTTTTTTEAGGAEPVGEPRDELLESPDFPGTGPTAQLVDVRVAAHDSFDRVVFEFADRVPAYRVDYQPDPVVEQPTGREIEVAGDIALVVTMSLASGVDLTGEEFEETYTGPERLTGPGTEAVREAVQIEDFEATLSWALGLTERLPFAVATFEDPPRVVVDVFHPAGGDDAAA